MMRGNGLGINWKGLYVTSLLDAHSDWRDAGRRTVRLAQDLDAERRVSLNKYRGHFYAKAQNLARQLSAAYDAALAEYDLLLMPTLPMRATKLPDRPTRAARSCSAPSR